MNETSATKTSYSLLSYALTYAAAGLHIFPLHGIVDGVCTCGRPACKRPGKHPYLVNGQDAATTNRSQIEAWWTATPDLNIGCHVGLSGIYVIDDDTARKDSQAIATLADRGVALRTACHSFTGGGGQHLFFRASGTELDKPSVNILGSIGLDGIDVRAGASYVVLPPSAHASGTPYAWCRGVHKDNFRSSIPALPPEWIELVKTVQKLPRPAVASQLDDASACYPRDLLMRLLGKLGRSMPLEDLRLIAAAVNQVHLVSALTGPEIDDLVEYIANQEQWRFGDDTRTVIPVEFPPSLAIRVLEEAICTFAQSRELPRVFIQNGSFSEVLESDDDRREIVRLDDSRLKRLAMRVARFEKKGSEVAVPPTIIELLRSSPTIAAVRQKLPVVREVVTRPYVDAEGAVIAAPTYIRSTRQLALIPDSVSARVTEALSLSSEARAMAAEKFLKGAFSDTPFADEGGWPRCLAMAVTAPISRWLGDGEKWPWLLIDAPVQATGKSTLARGVGALAGGSIVIRYKQSDDEMEKALYDPLQKGTPCVILDNLTHKVDSQLISILVTEREISLRRLGTNSTPSFVNNLMIVGTANNPVIGKDLASRALHVRLDSRLANPDSRQYSRSTPEVVIKNSAEEYEGAIYDLIGWWIKRGMPLSSDETVTRFRRWERAVRQILGGVGLSLDFTSEIPADPVDEAFRAFVGAWWELAAEDEIVMDQLHNLAFVRKHLIPALGQNEVGRLLEHRDAANSKLGKLLQSKRDVLFAIEHHGVQRQVTIKRTDGRNVTYRLQTMA